MKLYTKTIDGKNVIKPLNKIVVINDGWQIINPSHEILINDGWTLYEPEEVTMTDDEIFQNEKNNLLNVIASFDNSDSVNNFYMQGEPMWLDFENRSRLLLRFQAETNNGNETTTLWYNGKEYTLPLDVAIKLLYELETYASKCFDNTQRHLAEVRKIETLEELKNYDYMSGYPEQLRF
jgi:hypothetical protein